MCSGASSVAVSASSRRTELSRFSGVGAGRREDCLPSLRCELGGRMDLEACVGVSDFSWRFVIPGRLEGFVGG